jgi:mRNA interferase RelE/StbE
VKYSIEIKRGAEKHIRQLPIDALRLINPRILALADDPRPHGVKKLGGGLGWRIRIGDYRVIYEIDDDRHAVTIAAVKPRQSAYE